MQLDCTRALRARRATPALLALVAAACEPHDHGHDHDNEVISLIELTFTPTGGGDALVFTFNDPDGDGGASGVAERISLSAGVEYTLTISLLNSLVDPPEDLTEEIKAEAEDHQIFLLGDLTGPASAAGGLLTHAYADRESDYGANAVGADLPVGLRNTITAEAAGAGELRLMLRHLPEVNGQAQKTADLAADLAAGMDLPGSVDVDITFDLVVE